MQGNVVGKTVQSKLQIDRPCDMNQFGSHALPGPNNILGRYRILLLKFKMDLIQR